MVGVVSVVASTAYFVLVIYLMAMWARFGLDLALVVARSWQPRGLLLVLAEGVFTVTDPPIRFVRRFVRPLRVGSGAIDFSWTIVMLAVIILMSVVSAFTGTGR